MPDRLLKRAGDSYHLERDGSCIAALTRETSSGRWRVALLDARREYPPPFEASMHRFRTFGEAREWLGQPEIVDQHGAGRPKRWISRHSGQGVRIRTPRQVAR
jgi:hypothetical protein